MIEGVFGNIVEECKVEHMNGLGILDEISFIMMRNRVGDNTQSCRLVEHHKVELFLKWQVAIELLGIIKGRNLRVNQTLAEI